MILVLLGTNPYSFKRLVVAMDSWALKSGRTVFIQLGHTKEKPLNCRYVHFLEKEKLLELICQAEFVVSQGGFGSLRECILAKKKIIAVPRYKSLGECLDDQEQVVRALESEGRLLAVFDMNYLESTLNRIEKWEAEIRGNSKVTSIINNYLKKMYQD